MTTNKKVIKKESIKKLVRLCWNDNKGWLKPTFHPWEKKYKDDKNKSFVQKFGYGHEEWLFNERYKLNGWQYGSIQGLDKYRKTDFIDELHLFTIDENTKVRYYIGFIKNVSLLFNKIEEVKNIEELIDFEQMKSDLISVAADYETFDNLSQDDKNPKIKFLMDDVFILPEIRIIDSYDFKVKYFRYQPFYFNGIIEKIVRNQ